MKDGVLMIIHIYAKVSIGKKNEKIGGSRFGNECNEGGG